MVNWKAAVHTWEANEPAKPTKTPHYPVGEEVENTVLVGRFATFEESPHATRNETTGDTILWAKTCRDPNCQRRRCREARS